MIECRDVEGDDIRVPPFMIRVTRSAIIVTGIRMPTMESGARGDIGAHGAVTARTQGVLTVFIRLDVAVATIVFIRGMSLG